jgi:hypothetical protein
MDSQPPEWVLGLTPLHVFSIGLIQGTFLVAANYHDTLRKIRFCNDDRPHAFQQGHQNAVLGCGLECTANIAQRAVVSFDVELIFQGHGYTMQRPNKAIILAEGCVEFLSLLKSIREQDLCQAKLQSDSSKV